jgi:peptide/nickel transport system permease protein
MRAVLIRLGHMALVLVAVTSILFLMFRLMPGDPTAMYIDVNFSEEQRLAIKRAFGLDRPLYEQYVLYIWNLLHGQLGTSFHYKQPVLAVITGVLPNTLILTLTALFAGYAFGVLVGAWLAGKRGTAIEGAVIPAVLTMRAAPEFWLGMVLLAVFGFGLGWFPSGGANSPGATFPSELARILSLDFLHHLALPALTLALYLQGLPLLLMRQNMLDVMQEDFIMMARMKGLSQWSILLRHAARNALLPVVTAFAIAFGNTIAANVVIETVFSWPGLGRLMVQAVASSDYPLAQGAFLMIAVILVMMNFVADALYVVLDPRVSHGAR